MSLSPWASAEAARLRHADLLADAAEHRRIRTLREHARPERWPGILRRRVAPRRRMIAASCTLRPS